MNLWQSKCLPYTQQACGSIPVPTRQSAQADKGGGEGFYRVWLKIRSIHICHFQLMTVMFNYNEQVIYMTL